MITGFKTGEIFRTVSSGYRLHAKARPIMFQGDLKFFQRTVLNDISVSAQAINEWAFPGKILIATKGVDDWLVASWRWQRFFRSFLSLAVLDFLDQDEGLIWPSKQSVCNSRADLVVSLLSQR